MPVFLWQARTRLGETRSGEMEAATADMVTQRLRAQNMLVDKVKKKPIEIHLRMPGSSGVTTRDLVVFTRQFATMIDAGLPLMQCLEILSSQTENADFRKILTDVKNTVAGGRTLAEALDKHPKVFNRLFVNLVAAGEAGGVLDVILLRLATYIEKSAKLVKQVKSALTYPMVVVGVAGVVTSVLVIFVIPVFEEMFSNLGSALPTPTQIVLDISRAVRGNILIILPALVILGGVLTAFIKSRTGKELVDRLVLHLPGIGPVVQKVAVAKFSRTLSTMLSSGVNILEGLDIVAGTAGNVVVETGLRQVRKSISEGRSIAKPLSEIPVFPPMVVQMIAVGEQAGAMDTMLSKIADFYDDEVDEAVTTMTTLIEPAIMAFLAVVLGGLVIALYLPMFQLAGTVG